MDNIWRLKKLITDTVNNGAWRIKTKLYHNTVVEVQSDRITITLNEEGYHIELKGLWGVEHMYSQNELKEMMDKVSDRFHCAHNRINLDDLNRRAGEYFDKLEGGL